MRDRAGLSDPPDPRTSKLPFPPAGRRRRSGGAASARGCGRWRKSAYRSARRCRSGDAVHPALARRSGEDEEGPARQGDGLVPGHRAAPVGARAARAEAHGPGGGKAERCDGRPEIAAVGVHADPPIRPVLVDDAPDRRTVGETGAKAFREEAGPFGKGRGRIARTLACVVVAVAVVLDAAAEIGEPGRLADALEDAGLLGRRDQVGHDDRAPGEDARVPGHARSPVRCALGRASLSFRLPPAEARA